MDDVKKYTPTSITVALFFIWLQIFSAIIPFMMKNNFNNTPRIFFIIAIVTVIILIVINVAISNRKKAASIIYTLLTFIGIAISMYMKGIFEISVQTLIALMPIPFLFSSDSIRYYANKEPLNNVESKKESNDDNNNDDVWDEIEWDEIDMSFIKNNREIIESIIENGVENEKEELFIENNKAKPITVYLEGKEATADKIIKKENKYTSIFIAELSELPNSYYKLYINARI